jgi:hypothetical protein
MSTERGRMNSKRHRVADVGISLGEPGALWTDLHAPRKANDLIIRKNKIEELFEWIKNPYERVCILCGPAGCGKTTMLRVLSAECGWELVEYVPEIQLPWNTFTSRNNMYQSKLESFESYCSRAWMPTLNIEAKHRETGHLVVLDDVPTVVGEDHMMRLVKAAMMLLSRSPKTVIVVTSVSSRDSSEQHEFEQSSIPKQLLRAIESQYRPRTISLNPIPKATMVKHLAAIADKQNVRTIPKSDLQLIAEQSQGDLSSAILSLQFASAGKKLKHAPQRRQRKVQKTDDSDMIQVLSHMMRDSSLSIFHGLGKLLYNKRLSLMTGENAPPLSWMDRPPMDGFQPEETVHASGLSGSSVTAFLHENIPSFVDDEYIWDLSQCLEYLSFADTISHHWDTTPYYGTMNDEPDGSQGLSDMIASMIASRGVCFWNTHPAPRSWKPLKAPISFKVEHGRRTNTDRLSRACSESRILCGHAMDQSTFESMATEFLPYIRVIGRDTIHQQPSQWDRYWQGSITTVVVHGSHPTTLPQDIAQPDDDDDPIE